MIVFLNSNRYSIELKKINKSVNSPSGVNIYLPNEFGYYFTSNCDIWSYKVILEMLNRIGGRLIKLPIIKELYYYIIKAMEA